MSEAAVAEGTVAVDSPAPGVRRLRIDNASRRGALSTSVLAGLRDGVADVGSDVRCLLLAGSGSMFCAGYDLRALSCPPDPEHADATIAPEHVEILDMLEAQPLPVVAALNGPALGGGLELALACDVRLAVPSAKLGAPAGRLGLVYSAGGLERVAREIPYAIAADLFLAGGMLSAERAFGLGLLARIVEPEELDDAAVAAAAAIASLAPLSVRANRRALRALRRSSGEFSPGDRVELERAREEGMHSRDFAEGVQAFRERRDPRFDGE